LIRKKKGKRVKEKFARKNFQSTKDWLERKKRETTLQGSERNKKKISLWKLHTTVLLGIYYILIMCRPSG